MRKRITYFISIWSILGCCSALAQETIVTGGGKAEGSNGNSAYSVGQLLAVPVEGDDVLIVPGVQHAFEISAESGMVDDSGVNLTLTAFPNPASETLILDVDTFSVTNLTYRLFDQEGTLVKMEHISNVQTRIPTNDLAKATYFLRVLKSDELLKTFKIVKN
ncbi:T9SS type A sorting domain-containing protein [Saccharicrinis sp. FJH54]|uniref:T9SS type A sorting domain-containing protein n=1 Tax=Saccharicrinis sp. FJH54 TaxID=3344665 RepID=UPI0035D472F9